MKIIIISLSVTHSLSFARKDKKIPFVFSRQLEFLLGHSPPPLFLSCPFHSRNSQLSILSLGEREFQRRIRLFGNQTETSKNKGKSIQDPRSANTEAVSICSLLTSRNATSLTKNHQFRLPVPALLVETSRALLAPEYQLPLDIREHARTKSIPAEHKVRTGGHSLDSRPLRERPARKLANFRVAEPLLSLTVSYETTGRETKGKKRKREYRRKTIEEGNPRSLPLIFVSQAQTRRRCRSADVRG